MITGRIGAGKTTLLRTLLGLLPRTEGELYWKWQTDHGTCTLLRATSERLHAPGTPAF
nr:ATP-binding cassette domain-containing protein [Ktedonobacter robiniae]